MVAKRRVQCPLVMIEWVDSVQPQSRWEMLANVGHPSGVKCVSVGWLVSDQKDRKSLAPNMGAVGSESMQVSGIITIPARSITKITRLKEPRIKI